MAYVSTKGWTSYFGEPTFQNLGRSRWRRNLVPAVKRDVLLSSLLDPASGDDGVMMAAAVVSGLGAWNPPAGWPPSPVGYPDFYSFQGAVTQGATACPPPYDPTCENPRDAAIAAALESWKTTPGSCGVIVCDSNGQPAVSYQTYTTPSGQVASGYVVNSNQGPIPVSAPAVVAAPAPLLASAPTGTSLPAATSPRPGFHPPTNIAAAVPPSGAVPPKYYTPVLLFITSRGNNSLLVGDTWTIQINGAPPNTPVTVTGNSCGNCTDSTTTSMGSTDGIGNFLLSGTIAAASVGVWGQQWSVGSQAVGHIAFTVAAAIPQNPPPASPPPGSGAPSSGQPPAAGACDPSIDPTCSSGTPATGASFFQQTVTIGGLQIPVWAFIAAAGGAVLLFMGEKS